VSFSLRPLTGRRDRVSVRTGDWASPHRGRGRSLVWVGAAGAAGALGVAALVAAGPVTDATAVASAATVASAASASTSAGSVAVAGLETDASVQPLGIDDATPRLSWRLTSERRAVAQSAYQVLVASTPERLQPGQADVWDSGKVTSANPWAQFAGRSLMSQTRYDWTVRVWDEQGTATAWSPAQWFETGLMNPSEWSAQWITRPLASGEAERTDCLTAPGQRENPACAPPSPILRTEFNLPKRVANARVYMSALGYGLLHVNGQRVGDAELDPAPTDYTHRTFYVTHDVTGLLHTGANALGVELGRGFYAFDRAITVPASWDKAPWHDEPKLRLELHVRYTDGTTTVIRSGPDWRATTGPTLFDNMFFGETYDGQRAAALAGWTSPGYADADWPRAVEAKAPTGALMAQDVTVARVTETRRFQSVKQVAPGTWVLDLGQQVAGWALLHVAGPAGAQVQMLLSEKTTPTGVVVGSSDAPAGQSQQVPTYTQVYRLAGGGQQETWEPHFSYTGFRYVQITGWPDPAGPSLDDVVARVVHTDLPRIGRLHASNPLLDKIVDAAAWSIANNAHGVITDTPVYEKAGWSGDASLSAEARNWLFDARTLDGKWVRDLAGSQDVNGELPDFAPTPKGDPVAGISPAWDAAIWTVPEAGYRFTGDDAKLRELYPVWQRYYQYFTANTSGAIANTRDYGDWCGVPTCDTADVIAAKPEHSTAFYYMLINALQRSATLLGHPDDAQAYQSRADQVRTAFNAQFFDPATNSYHEANQPAGTYKQYPNVIGLAAGLVPPDRVDAVTANLENDLRLRGNHVDLGIIGVRYLFDVLTRTGRVQTAYDVATQTTYPSYGYWIQGLGLTALPEDWTGLQRSQNHHMFSSIVAWFFQDLAGIQPVDPGFGQIQFRPEIPKTGLDWMQASYDSVRGTVSSQWRKSGNGFELDVTVPPGSTGLVYFPGTDPRRIAETGQRWAAPADTAQGVALVGVQGDRVIYRVGSGTYKFQTIDPATLPDLTVTDVSASQDKPKQTVLTATVANPGGGNADGVVVEFRDGNTVLGQTAPVSVAAGASATVSYTWDTRGINGDHVITAVVDPANTIGESDETNNSLSRTITIRGNKVDNGSFESSPDGAHPDAWSNSGSGTSYDASGTQASDGKAAVGVTGGGALTSGPTWTSAPIAVSPGTAYNVAMTVATSGSSSPPSLSVSYLDSTGTVLNTVAGIATTLTGDATAQQVSGHIVVPAGVSKIRLILSGFAAGDPAPTGTTWFDDIWLW
jgi:alpha-L-rhamnosidase